MENILVCLAWPYANGDAHVGHIAGAYLPADIFARYQRLTGNRVVVVSGSDSHGTPIVVSAEKQGKTPRALFEHFHARFLQTWIKLGISYDLYTHTDTENHHAIAQQMFTRLNDNGQLFLAKQKQVYSEKQQKFLPDRFVEGTCPICAYDKARGDQCDNCGNLLEAVQLINPRNRNLADDVLSIRESEHYMWDLPQVGPAIGEYLADKDSYWRPQVLNFARNFAKDLNPRAFTRDLTWGIPIPVPNSEGKCIYVWWEAVLGYLTATIEWAKLNGTPEAWKDFWYAPDNVKIYNFIGKDNILFHTVLWQGILLGMKHLGDEAAPRPGDNPTFNLPYDVPANQYVNLNGQKFSKSLGVSVEALELAEKYGADPVRFYLTQIMPEQRDADWSFEGFTQANNSELLAKWGNLAQRTLSQIFKNFDGAIPIPGALTEADQALLTASRAAFAAVGESLNAVRLREALTLAMELAGKANYYIDQQAPWKIIKVDKARAGTQLYVAAQVIDHLSVLLSPFVPDLCEAVRRQLGYAKPLFGRLFTETVHERTRDHEVLRYDAREADGHWVASQLAAGQKLGGEPRGLVTKIEVAKELPKT